MSDINYHAFRILQNAKDRQQGRANATFPSKEINRELKKMGMKRTPGTNGEGRKVIVKVNGTEYKILAIEI